MSPTIVIIALVSGVLAAVGYHRHGDSVAAGFETFERLVDDAMDAFTVALLGDDVVPTQSLLGGLL